MRTIKSNLLAWHIIHPTYIFLSLHFCSSHFPPLCDVLNLSLFATLAKGVILLDLPWVEILIPLVTPILQNMVYIVFQTLVENTHISLLLNMFLSMFILIPNQRGT